MTETPREDDLDDLDVPGNEGDLTEVPELDGAEEDISVELASDADAGVEDKRKRKPKTKTLKPKSGYQKYLSALFPDAASKDTYLFSAIEKEVMVSNGAACEDSRVLCVVFQLAMKRDDGSPHFYVSLDLVEKYLDQFTVSKGYANTPHNAVRSLALAFGLSEGEARATTQKIAKCLETEEGVLEYLACMGIPATKYRHLLSDISQLDQEAVMREAEQNEAKLRGQKAEAVAEAARRVTTLSEADLAKIRSGIHPSLL